MNIKQLSTALSVSAQISLDDLQAIKEQGFSAIICNRPDDEENDQPSFAAMAEAAKNLGLKISHIPVIGSQISAEDVAIFKAALIDLPQPILAYCRTGTRCTILWSRSQTEQQSIPEILAITKAAGYDMSAHLK